MGNPKQTVCLHGWRNADNGDCEYSDYESGEHCDGFNAYLRIEAAGEDQPFDVPEAFDRDFPTIGEAREYAAKLAAERGADIFEY